MSEALSEGEERFSDLLALSRSDECAPAMLYCVEHRHVGGVKQVFNIALC